MISWILGVPTISFVAECGCPIRSSISAAAMLLTGRWSNCSACFPSLPKTRSRTRLFIYPGLLGHFHGAEAWRRLIISRSSEMIQENAFPLSGYIRLKSIPRNSTDRLIGKLELYCASAYSRFSGAVIQPIYRALYPIPIPRLHDREIRASTWR